MAVLAAYLDRWHLQLLLRQYLQHITSTTVKQKGSWMCWSKTAIWNSSKPQCTSTYATLSFKQHLEEVTKWHQESRLSDVLLVPPGMPPPRCYEYPRNPWSLLQPNTVPQSCVDVQTPKRYMLPLTMLSDHNWLSEAHSCLLSAIPSGNCPEWSPMRDCCPRPSPKTWLAYPAWGHHDRTASKQTQVHLGLVVSWANTLSLLHFGPSTRHQRWGSAVPAMDPTEPTANWVWAFWGI